ncbi:MAG: glycosyltransferase family 8 protein [Thermoguttaceae bacterium]|nr:glycosyltransferase family 8 protein [Thermoguttaceae bacterium]
MLSSNSTNAPIEILLVSDKNYAPFLATTIASILKNAAPDDVLSVRVVDAGLSLKDREIVENLKSIRSFRLTFYKPDLSEYLKLFPNDIGNFPVVCNYRLFLGEYLPREVDKILYMDVDAIAIQSLRELWETPLDDQFLAAAKDSFVSREHIEALDLSKDYVYFNSGVLLVNVKKWRDDGLLEKILRTAVKIRDKIAFQDQDVLNVLANEIGYREIDGKWNCRPDFYEEDKTCVLHYMGVRNRLPRLDLLAEYVALTPYGKLPFQTKWYQTKLKINKIVCQLCCLFLPKREWRRKCRKRFKLR